MSRIFSISGNFIQNGAWSTPDPSFSGKIVVDDNDKFYGYCDELYEKTMLELNRTRYLIGVFAQNDSCTNKGISFYKLSNEGWQSPLMYVIPDLSDPEQKDATWGAFTEIFPWTGIYEMCVMGCAKINLAEEPFSVDEEKRIWF
ncbi:hypothetical protein IJG91_03305 [Candidatus Saccharibacteria bacterium]|nr:hypothetical protein [Candidatus Saccharibacteria bacterium]